MYKIAFISPFFVLLTIFSSIGQSAKQVQFEERYWEVAGQKHEFTTYKGKQCIYLENGAAQLKEGKLQNGIIDFDMAFEDARAFLSVRFRIQNDSNFEEFYVRPHQSGNPDAMQYTPVFNGKAGWQLYHGKGYSATYSYNFGEWIHVRLIISGDQMEVFINDMSQPILPVHDLKLTAAPGGIGFGSSLSGAYFANFSYKEMTKPTLVNKTEALPEIAPEFIQNWQVSQELSSTELAKFYQLKDFYKNNTLRWQSITPEYSGMINISQVATASEETNTVLVKTIINSDKDQIKQLQFGYSDIANVYVNGKIIYSGQNIFRSRDYRYLGTIGFFDSVYLDLKKGDNEIIFGVTENFGGWGLKAKLEDLDGVKLK